jgi:predicted lipoprotein with Yx(FWY)xxD motif
MRGLIAVAATAGLMLAGCGGDDGDSNGGSAGAAESVSTTATAAQQPSPAEPAAATGTTIQVSSSDYGRILFDRKDQAIYLFEKESGPTSECYGECAEAWPPVLTEGAPQAGAGADQSLLGTTERDDGTTQVTYNGHPLYYYVDDPPGEVLCQNVDEFGGLWLVVTPNGEPVRGG